MVEDLMAGWWQLIIKLGAVPQGLEQAQRAHRRLPGRPANPEAKGVVERLRDYLERSFLPGRPVPPARTSFGRVELSSTPEVSSAI
ncbi:hypothetical protein GCU60_10125 [Blastococcus saxobsidens]|uniref:Uncharacterized protein n=1 Tax=Blastococcus saxobsidens TaxID=138336 RepID=A0A6L9W2R5_9ACTN|nr:hypothetical protein [Blastococcus saxobsidens]NEK86112.1 hypothetical protein [Blastococcus saxobsidens]